MFRQLASFLQTLAPPRDLFDLQPVQLARAMEDTWAERAIQNVQPTTGGAPNPAYEVRLRPETVDRYSWPPTRRAELVLDGFALTWATPPTWPHLAYGYMIEQTFAYEVFGRVLREYARGERLGAPSDQTRTWLRATEELFYYDTPPYQVSSLISHVRPDIRASRRNAYFRMFGMDLTHGAEGGGAYPYEKPVASNREFVQVWEELLREAWRGIEHAGNSSGPNPTDDTMLSNLCRSLQQMLISRRSNGNLAREEFVFATSMSWFHLTLEYNSPVVRDLKADGASPSERLRLVGERVGMPTPAKADNYFSMAEPMSRILLEMERGTFNDVAGVRTLYAVPPNPIRDDMTTIITNWSAATGRPMKAPLTGVVGAVQPTSATLPTPAPPVVSYPAVMAGVSP
jgi:hypothetical protein